MLVLIRGGSGSGKSAFAEDLCLNLIKNAVRDNASAGGPIYLATMTPSQGGAADRIKRHRELRAGKGFVTFEKSGDIGTLSFPGKTVLLESLSDLMANEMFAVYDDASGNDTANNNSFGNDSLGNDVVLSSWNPIDFDHDKITRDIKSLYGNCSNLIVVSDNVFCDGISYSKETESYMEKLARVEADISGIADAVYEVAAGIPVCIKGKLNCNHTMDDKKTDLQTGDEMDNIKRSSGETAKVEKNYRSSSETDGIGKNTVSKRTVCLIIGGAFQGKRAYAQTGYGVPDRDLIDLNSRVKDCIAAGKDPKSCIEEILGAETSDNKGSAVDSACYSKVIISTMAGCGIVPMDKKEREEREIIGRLQCDIAKIADEVILITAGCPLKIK